MAADCGIVISEVVGGNGNERREDNVDIGLVDAVSRYVIAGMVLVKIFCFTAEVKAKAKAKAAKNGKHHEHMRRRHYHIHSIPG